MYTKNTYQDNNIFNKLSTSKLSRTEKRQLTGKLSRTMSKFKFKFQMKRNRTNTTCSKHLSKIFISPAAAASLALIVIMITKYREFSDNQNSDYSETLVRFRLQKYLNK